MTIKQQGGIFGRNPTFNEVDVDADLTVDTDTFYVNASSNEVCVGQLTSINAGKLNVKTDSAHNGISVTPYADNYYSYYGTNAAGSQTFYVRGDGVSNFQGAMTVNSTIINTGNHVINSGNLVINTSGNGIDFSATSGTGTSELFDDYEEGTFTPTLYGNATAGTYELATASGTYTKVGRVVTAQVLLVLAGSVTGGGSGDTVIGGLPFTYDGSENVGQHSAVASGGVSFAAGATVTASKITSSDDNRLTLYESVAGTSIATVPITDFGANDLVSFTVTYFSI